MIVANQHHRGGWRSALRLGSILFAALLLAACDNTGTGLAAPAGGAGRSVASAGCADCHMFVGGEDGSNSSMFHGHSMAITVVEEGGGSTTSCTQCHQAMDTTEANGIIDGFKTSFQALFATTEANVAAAVQAMQGVTDPDLLAKLDEARHNLEYAGFDESGGVHNHNYLMALLQDANTRALEILAHP